MIPPSNDFICGTSGNRVKKRRQLACVNRTPFQNEKKFPSSQPARGRIGLQRLWEFCGPRLSSSVLVCLCLLGGLTASQVGCRPLHHRCPAARPPAVFGCHITSPSLLQVGGLAPAAHCSPGISGPDQPPLPSSIFTISRAADACEDPEVTQGPRACVTFDLQRPLSAATLFNASLCASLLQLRLHPPCRAIYGDAWPAS